MRVLARLAFLGACLVLALVDPALAIEYVDNPPPLIDRLTPEVLALVFPGAGRLEPIEGPPSAVAVYDGDNLTGYIFSSLDVVHARGFVYTPFDVIAGMTLDGRITGIKQVFNRESYIYGNARRTELLDAYLASLAGLVYNQLIEARRRPDYVTGATISARSMRSAVTDSGRVILRSLVGIPAVTQPTLDRDGYTPITPAELVANGSVRTLTLTNGEVAAALAAAGAPADARPDTAFTADPDALYIEFQVALATPPTIGRNLIYAEATFDRLTLNYPEGTQGILLISNGRYNHQGVKYLNASSNFLLDRIEIEQGANRYVFHGEDYFRATGPLGQYGGVLVLRPDTGFDPLLPWTAMLLVHATAPDGSVTTASFPLEYELPPQYILLPEPEPVPAWVETWRESRADVIILASALFVLTLLFAFQARLARYRSIHRWVRNGFLVFTIVWLGYVAGGQLSIIHIVNFLRAPFENADVGFYLAEPLIIIIAVYAAVAMILIGRGVFCGWLCPFGALQELAYKAGRLLRLPEWNPSPKLQGWMWLPKYGTAALVIGTAFIAPSVSAAASEIEPFKTAITSAFDRPWPFIAYAVVLLGVGLFSERAFCRFLCPLGGFLAVLDRLHLLNLLKRRPECGSPCQLCSLSCPVKAITPQGKIVTAECFQCLDCQVEYYDDRRCPPLARQRKQREIVLGRPAVVGGPALARGSASVR